MLYSLCRWQNSDIEQDQSFSKVPGGTHTGVGTQQGTAPASRLLSLPGDLGSRRRQKHSVKPQCQDMKAKGHTHSA